MFGKFFGRKEASAPSPKAEAMSPQEAAFFKALDDKRKDDPLIGARLGGQEVTQRLMAALRNDHGVHVETLLACIGSLGGYACHMAIRNALVDTGKLKENEAFVIVGATDGRSYYFGDYINKPLVEDRVSFWALVGGAVQHLDPDGVPEVGGIFQWVASTVGGEQFGVPQVPDKHRPASAPLELVKALWPALLPVVDKFCQSPVERPYLFGFCAQQVIEMAKETIAPRMAAALIMECAVPMSKIGPAWLEG